MPYLHNHRLFISHAWSYSERYERAVRFLNDASNFEWTNYSVPVDDAFPRMSKAELAEAMRRQIRPVQCVVIVSGMYVNHRDSVRDGVCKVPRQADFRNQTVGGAENAAVRN
ncbi:TIR domain-containing protein [Mesorhizobium australicum]|uniref:TIR domain-containing protein n=1 Tax=Mesorhizobium australicum TaxID=536018 RepID=UPI00333C8EF7